MAITWNQPTQPVATKSGGGIKWNNPAPTLPEGQTNFGAAQGALGHSQSLMDSALGFTGGIMPGIAKSVGGTIKGMSDMGQHVAEGVSNTALQGMNALTGHQAPMAQADYLPEVDQALKPQGAGEQVGHAIGEAGQFLGLGGLDLARGAVGAVKAIPAALDAVKAEGIGGLVSKGVSGAKNLIQSFAEKRADKAALNANIEAVAPKLEGKKLIKAQKEVMTGGREVTPPSIFHEQKLLPGQQSVNLAKRLQQPIQEAGQEGVNLHATDHVGNQETMKAAMTDTEQKLTTALGDPNVVNLKADKAGLFDKIDNAVTEAPTEHRLKDPEGLMNSVGNFAKKMVAEADHNWPGLRDARTAFYNQAKKEYPNAFGETGKIDTKSPAGYAIQQIGDIMGQHIYDTAPNGSLLQKLIGREADLFRANDVVAEKAAAGEGKSLIKQTIETHPKKATAAITAGGLLGGDWVKNKLGL